MEIIKTYIKFTKLANPSEFRGGHVACWSEFCVHKEKRCSLAPFSRKGLKLILLS